MSPLFRDSFEYPEKLIFLNSGSMSLTPKKILAQAEAYKKIYELNPTEGLFKAWDKMWLVQKQVAEFVNARPNDLFFRTNVTYVMNDFLMALQLPPKSEILISNLEYGAIKKICQYKATIEGHEFREIELYPADFPAEELTEEIILENLAAQLKSNTKLVMLSHVMTGTGLKIPLEKIAELLRSKNIFFAVDGAHGAGCCDLEFSQSKVDFYGTNLHKWLMGPKGTGFGWVAPQMREFLKPQFAGWTTGEIPIHFAGFGDGDAWTSRWMICSTHNFSDFYAITDTLQFWKNLDCASVTEVRNQLVDSCISLVSQKTGWKCLSNYNKELRSPLIAFKLPERLQQKSIHLMDELFLKHNLVISMPWTFNEWTLRLSPNIYNTQEEIEKAAEILARV